MNGTFDIKRFGKWFLHDLRNAKNHYWLSLLITGLMPVIIFVFFELFHRTLTGNWGEYNWSHQVNAILITFFVTTFSFPSKVYGRITERRAGSVWLMTPASALEKWLSMILIVCVALPLCLGILFLGSDLLLSVTAAGYSNSILHRIGEFSTMMKESTDGLMDVNSGGMLFLNWCVAILSFTLGALVFKKAKVAKTILAWIVFGLFIAPMIMALTGRLSISSEDIECLMCDPSGFETFIRKLNVIFTVTYVLFIGGMAGWLYARIRTLKH